MSVSVHAHGAKRIHVADVAEGIPLCGAKLGTRRESSNRAPNCPTCIAILRDRKNTQRAGSQGDLASAPFVSAKIGRGTGGRADFQIVVPYGATKAEVQATIDRALEGFDILDRRLGPLA